MDETFELTHPLNRNIKYKFQRPQSWIGGKVEQSALEAKLNEVVAKMADPEMRALYQADIEEALVSLRGVEQTGTLYTLLLLMTNQSIPTTFEELEIKALELMGPRRLDIQVRVQRLLRPLYLFIGLVASRVGGKSSNYFYKWKGSNVSVDERKNPLVLEGDFVTKNYFFGDKVLARLDTDMSLDYFWENVSMEVFDQILSDQTVGSITAAWDYAGQRYDNFKIYIYSKATRAKFAELVAYEILLSSGGNAYPGRIDGGGRMNYNISSGLATRRQHERNRRRAKDRLSKIYKARDKFEVKF